MTELDRIRERIDKICNVLSYVGGIAIAAAAGVIGIIAWWTVFG